MRASIGPFHAELLAEDCSQTISKIHPESDKCGLIGKDFGRKVAASVSQRFVSFVSFVQSVSSSFP